MRSSKKVRSNMKVWVVSDTGDTWTVKLDVRDLGDILLLLLGPGPLRLVIASPRLSPGFSLSLFFPWTLVVCFGFCVRCTYPAALHGAEASLVSISGLRRLRSAFGRAATSGGLRLANPCAFLSLLDGPAGSDPGYCVVRCRFRMLRRQMAYNSSVHELARVYSLLRVVAAGVPGHGPVHLWVLLGS